MNAPTQMPITTHRRRPNIDVGFDSSLLRNDVSKNDMLRLKTEKLNLKGFKEKNESWVFMGF